MVEATVAGLEETFFLICDKLQREFYDQYDPFESPLDWQTLRSLACVSKPVRSACLRMQYAGLRTKVYQRYVALEFISFPLLLLFFFSFPYCFLISTCLSISEF
jgi:hypothetical protein